MTRRVVFITGTDTGIGKTILASALCRHWRATNPRVAALKPLASGSRTDARELFKNLDGALALDEINPWHFKAALSPLSAARLEGRAVQLADVSRHVRAIQGRFPIVIVEGAGGLLSPLGEGFDSRDLIRELNATPLVICPNRLGAVNQVRLVIEALPGHALETAHLILVSAQRANAASRGNLGLLREFFPPERIHVFPWLTRCTAESALKCVSARKMLTSLVSQLERPANRFDGQPGNT